MFEMRNGLNFYFYCCHGWKCWNEVICYRKWTRCPRFFLLCQRLIVFLSVHACCLPLTLCNLLSCFVLYRPQSVSFITSLNFHFRRLGAVEPLVTTTLNEISHFENAGFFMMYLRWTAASCNLPSRRLCCHHQMFAHRLTGKSLTSLVVAMGTW